MAIRKYFHQDAYITLPIITLLTGQISPYRGFFIKTVIELLFKIKNATKPFSVPKHANERFK